MKILKLSHGYPPTISGVTLVVQKFARAMVQRGHEVMVITAGKPGEASTKNDQGVQLVRLGGWTNPFWSEGPVPAIRLSQLKAWIDIFQPDLLHTHENVFLSTQALRLRKSLNIPFISSCYFLPQYITHYLQGNRRLNRMIQDTIWRYIISNLNRYDQVIFSTATQRDQYAEHGLAVPTKVISNGVDTKRYHPPLNGWKPQDIEQRYNLPNGGRILFVGRLMKDKRIDLLIQAVDVVRREAPGHLLIVGRGDEKSALESQISSLGLREHVHFLDYIPEADLPDLYRAVDMFAIASICEVQSLPTLQATVTGLPVVAVDAAALPELVHNQKNGYLVAPGQPQEIASALLKILRDPDGARKMGEESIKIGAEHAEEKTFQAYEDFYTSFLG